jgi:D-amino peptidase
MRINGTEVGEIGLEAAMAGEFGVPLVFVSADSGGVREARELLGQDVDAVEVKKAITQNSGICLPIARTEQMLRRAAAEAMLKAPTAPPVVFQSPATIEVVFTTPQSADVLRDAGGIRRIDDVTVRTDGNSVLAAYRRLTVALAGRREE